MSTYARFPVAFVKGRGARLWDEAGKEYLDFLAGIAVVNLGHAHPRVAAAVAEQAQELVHVSNFFRIREQEQLACKLCELSFADRVFFCNSGAEANEGALKLARKWGRENRKGAYEIITTEGSFHGRTLFALSVTGQAKFHEGFEPLVPGVVSVPYNDVAAVEEAITDKTAAVIVEPIQGEGGVRVPAADYLVALRRVCDRHQVLLIYDEVQTGMGRTGHLFAYQDSGAAPDIMTLAKALGNGFPIAAVLANEKAAAAFGPGSHGSTFGGNLVACRAALAVLAELEDGALLAGAREQGEYLRARLEEVAARHECVIEVRGKGLMLGLALDRPGKPVVEFCLEKGVIINCTAETVLRFVPPLVIEREEIDLMIPVLEEGLSRLEKGL